ncbi:hypothetical protein GF324_05025, partial [bacterium]|nr:hypothetical protein [bacterium]
MTSLISNRRNRQIGSAHPHSEDGMRLRRLLRISILPAVLLILLYGPSTQAGETVRSITLENGLEVVMMPDGSSPLLSSLVVVRTGSAYETLTSAGATHMLEHMLFRGTETRTQGEIYDGFDLMGAYYNAQTAKTYTNFILVVPSRHARDAMELHADMILHSTIPADTFEVEKGRVVNELKQSYDRASDRAERFHLQKTYGGTSYAFPTLGTIPGIESMSRETVAEFYHDWYAVNNMVLVLRGNLSFAEMEELAEQVYGNESPRTLPERPTSWPTGFDGWESRQVHLTHGATRTGLLRVSIPAPRYDEADYPAYTLLTSILEDRLKQALTESSPPRAMYLYLDTNTDPNFSVTDIHIGLAPNANAKEVTDEALEIVHSLSGTELSDSLLQATLANERRSELFFSEQVQYGSFLLVPKLALAPRGFWERFEQMRDSVDLETAVAAAAQWLDRADWIATAYLPEPPETESSEGVQLGPVNSDTLENGLVVIARQATNVPVSGLHLVARHRAEREGNERRGWAALLHRLLEKNSPDPDGLTLQQRMETIGMDLNATDNPMIPMDDYRTSSAYSYVRIEAVAEVWPDAMQLLGELIARDLPEQEAIDSEAQDLIRTIKRKEDKLSTLARAVRNDSLFRDDPISYSVYGDGSTLQEVPRGRLLSFKEEYFAPDNLILSVVSPAPPEDVFAMADIAFGSLPSASALSLHSLAETMPVDVERSRDHLIVKGSGTQGYLSMGFALETPPQNHHAAVLTVNSMISDLIYRDLGEKKGWAYGAGSGVTLRPDLAVWSASMALPEEH